jgi:hypothetical protein
MRFELPNLDTGLFIDSLFSKLVKHYSSGMHGGLVIAVAGGIS